MQERAHCLDLHSKKVAKSRDSALQSVPRDNTAIEDLNVKPPPSASLPNKDQDAKESDHMSLSKDDSSIACLKIGEDLSNFLQDLNANISLDKTAKKDLNVKAPPVASLPKKDQGAAGSGNMSTSEDESPRTPQKTGDVSSSNIEDPDANIANQTPEETKEEQQAILDSMQSKRTNDSTETEKTTISPSTKVQNKKGKRKYDDDDKEDLGRSNLDLLLEAVASDLIDETKTSEEESSVLEGEVISPPAKKRHKKIDHPTSKPSATKKGQKEQTPKVILKDLPIYGSI